MSTFGKRVQEMRLACSMTQEQLASKAGITQGVIAQIEGGRNKGSKHIVSLARALRVNPNWLETGRGQAGVVGNKESQNKHANTSAGPELRGRVPVISWVQAGDWAHAVDNNQPGHADEWAETTAPVHQHTYALRVNGDSMTSPTGEEPTFPHGTKIIVEPDLIDAPENLINRLLIVRSNGDTECTFKQLVRDSGVFYLKPINPRYPMLPLPADSVICGVVREKVVRYV